MNLILSEEKLQLSARLDCCLVFHIFKALESRQAWEDKQFEKRKLLLIILFNLEKVIGYAQQLIKQEIYKHYMFLNEPKTYRKLISHLRKQKIKEWAA